MLGQEVLLWPQGHRSRSSCEFSTLPSHGREAHMPVGVLLANVEEVEEEGEEDYLCLPTPTRAMQATQPELVPGQQVGDGSTLAGGLSTGSAAGYAGETGGSGPWDMTQDLAHTHACVAASVGGGAGSSGSGRLPLLMRPPTLSDMPVVGPPSHSSSSACLSPTARHHPARTLSAQSHNLQCGPAPQMLMHAASLGAATADALTRAMGSGTGSHRSSHSGIYLTPVSTADATGAGGGSGAASQRSSLSGVPVVAGAMSGSAAPSLRPSLSGVPMVTPPNPSRTRRDQGPPPLAPFQLFSSPAVAGSGGPSAAAAVPALPWGTLAPISTPTPVAAVIAAGGVLGSSQSHASPSGPTGLTPSPVAPGEEPQGLIAHDPAASASAGVVHTGVGDLAAAQTSLAAAAAAVDGAGPAGERSPSASGMRGHLGAAGLQSAAAEQPLVVGGPGTQEPMNSCNGTGEAGSCSQGQLVGNAPGRGRDLPAAQTPRAETPGSAASTAGGISGSRDSGNVLRALMLSSFGGACVTPHAVRVGSGAFSGGPWLYELGTARSWGSAVGATPLAAASHHPFSPATPHSALRGAGSSALYHVTPTRSSSVAAMQAAGAMSELGTAAAAAAPLSEGSGRACITPHRAGGGPLSPLPTRMSNSSRGAACTTDDAPAGSSGASGRVELHAGAGSESVQPSPLRLSVFAAPSAAAAVTALLARVGEVTDTPAAADICRLSNRAGQPDEAAAAVATCRTAPGTDKAAAPEQAASEAADGPVERTTDARDEGAAACLAPLGSGTGGTVCTSTAAGHVHAAGSVPQVVKEQPLQPCLATAADGVVYSQQPELDVASGTCTHMQQEQDQQQDQQWQHLPQQQQQQGEWILQQLLDSDIDAERPSPTLTPTAAARTWGRSSTPTLAVSLSQLEDAAVGVKAPRPGVAPQGLSPEMVSVALNGLLPAAGRDAQRAASRRVSGPGLDHAAAGVPLAAGSSPLDGRARASGGVGRGAVECGGAGVQTSNPAVLATVTRALEGVEEVEQLPTCHSAEGGCSEVVGWHRRLLWRCLMCRPGWHICWAYQTGCGCRGRISRLGRMTRTCTCALLRCGARRLCMRTRRTSCAHAAAEQHGLDAQVCQERPMLTMRVPCSLFAGSGCPHTARHAQPRPAA